MIIADVDLCRSTDESSFRLSTVGVWVCVGAYWAAYYMAPAGGSPHDCWPSQLRLSPSDVRGRAVGRIIGIRPAKLVAVGGFTLCFKCDGRAIGGCATCSDVGGWHPGDETPIRCPTCAGTGSPRGSAPQQVCQSCDGLGAVQPFDANRKGSKYRRFWAPAMSRAQRDAIQASLTPRFLEPGRRQRQLANASDAGTPGHFQGHFSPPILRPSSAADRAIIVQPRQQASKTEEEVEEVVEEEARSMSIITCAASAPRPASARTHAVSFPYEGRWTAPALSSGKAVPSPPSFASSTAAAASRRPAPANVSRPARAHAPTVCATSAAPQRVIERVMATTAHRPPRLRNVPRPASTAESPPRVPVAPAAPRMAARASSSAARRERRDRRSSGTKATLHSPYEQPIQGSGFRLMRNAAETSPPRQHADEASRAVTSVTISRIVGAGGRTSLSKTMEEQGPTCTSPTSIMMGLENHQSPPIVLVRTWDAVQA